MLGTRIHMFSLFTEILLQCMHGVILKQNMRVLHCHAVDHQNDILEIQKTSRGSYLYLDLSQYLNSIS
jgi:hypothetical protein